MAKGLTNTSRPSCCSTLIQVGSRQRSAATCSKQEVEAALRARARIFTDEVEQSVIVGEAQHAVAQGLIGADAVTALGTVIAGLAPGRTSSQEITLFDGTGIALQDLAVESIAVDIALARALAQEVLIGRKDMQLDTARLAAVYQGNRRSSVSRQKRGKRPVFAPDDYPDAGC